MWPSAIWHPTRGILSPGSSNQRPQMWQVLLLGPQSVRCVLDYPSYKIGGGNVIKLVRGGGVGGAGLAGLSNSTCGPLCLMKVTLGQSIVTVHITHYTSTATGRPAALSCSNYSLIVSRPLRESERSSRGAINILFQGGPSDHQSVREKWKSRVWGSTLIPPASQALQLENGKYLLV